MRNWDLLFIHPGEATPSSSGVKTHTLFRLLYELRESGSQPPRSVEREPL